MKTEKPSGKKHIRLHRKQRSFLNRIFKDGRTLREALADLRIRPQTFDRWLDDPRFRVEFEVRMVRIRFQSYIEAGCCVPAAEGEDDPFFGTQS